MIRLIASTIVERPMLSRSDRPPSKEQLVKRHINELPNTMRCFRNAIVSVSRWSKWVKLALLRHNVPVEIYDLIKPFLIRRGGQDFYPSVACDQWMPHRKYLLLEAKLCRLELAFTETLPKIRTYITDSYEFRVESNGANWYLRQFNILCRRFDFIEHVLMLRYQYKKDVIIDTVYDIEQILQYWF